MVYIEDLYVKPEFRSQSIGKELVQLTMKYAKSIGVNFLSLQVLEWNEGAINFYKKFDCELDKEWINAIIKIK
jgi:ribosomal protein S18 acetylase RimI-like enzyme